MKVRAGSSRFQQVPAGFNRSQQVSANAAVQIGPKPTQDPMEVCHSFYNTTLMGPLIQVSEATKVRENVLKLLTCWAKSQLGHKIPFTSVNVNKNYASKVDRDKHNLGPSVGLAVGSFTGGHLRYWPNHITSRAPTIQKMCPGISNKILLRNSYSKIAIFVNLSKLPKFRKCALAFQIRFCY